MSRTTTLAGRARQAQRLARAHGPRAVASRALARAAAALAPAGYGGLAVRREDLVAAARIAAGGWRLPPPAPHVPGEPLSVAWVAVPPHPAVGGHQTMFRMLGALERAGHECVLYLYDRHGWSHAEHVRTVRRSWPVIRAQVRDLADGIEDAHVVFATSWETAYPALSSPAAGARCYFVQDFEPAFYPAGSEALLAEATYRFGFHGITAGRWLAEMLRRDYGMSAEHFDFGADLDRYRLIAGGEQRAGVCCYCRPGTPRRAGELALTALDLFALERPSVPIHLFGRPAGRLTFAATDHGMLDADGLNALYNRCVGGLCLSATNSSLVPHEMLAAGCIPVVNDAEHNRVVLDNDRVVYAPAAPFELARALMALVDAPPAQRATAARQAAVSVRSTTWEHAGEQFERAVRRAVEAVGTARLAA